MQMTETFDDKVAVVIAQGEILRALSALPNPASRQRVLEAVGHILEADAGVPGVFNALLRSHYDAIAKSDYQDDNPYRAVGAAAIASLAVGTAGNPK